MSGELATLSAVSFTFAISLDADWGQEKGPAKQGIPKYPLKPWWPLTRRHWVLLQPCEVQGTWHCNEDTSALSPPSVTIQETKHALRTLLGGVWAKEKTSEIVTLLVQDNWNRGAFAEDVLSPKWKHIWFFLRGELTGWLSERKFRIKNGQPEEGKSGDKTRRPCSLWRQIGATFMLGGGYISAIPRSRFGGRGTWQMTERPVSQKVREKVITQGQKLK